LIYDTIRSLGITALEMAEGKAPYGDIHPMRAIFMIPSKPPPSFSEPDKWSSQFIDFVSRCLVKNPGSFSRRDIFPNVVLTAYAVTRLPFVSRYA
jgi:serine/threonine protein kinase